MFDYYHDLGVQADLYRTSKRIREDRRQAHLVKKFQKELARVKKELKILKDELTSPRDSKQSTASSSPIFLEVDMIEDSTIQEIEGLPVWDDKFGECPNFGEDILDTSTPTTIDHPSIVIPLQHEEKHADIPQCPSLFLSTASLIPDIIWYKGLPYRQPSPITIADVMLASILVSPSFVRHMKRLRLLSDYVFSLEVDKLSHLLWKQRVPPRPPDL